MRAFATTGTQIAQAKDHAPAIMKFLVALALAVHVSSSAADDCAPLPDEWDCGQFSNMCKVFDKTLCKVKNKGFIMTEAGCLAEGGDFVDVKWCPEQDLREKCNCRKGGEKCIVRKEANGKILTRDQDSPACESAEADDALDSNLFNCPNYEFLLNFYLERTVG
jgi:hypothetical protein